MALDEQLDTFPSLPSILYEPIVPLDGVKLQVPAHFTFATDSTLYPPFFGGGYDQDGKVDRTSIIMPKLHVTLEALLRIYARECGKEMYYCGINWIYGAARVIEKHGLLDDMKLPEPLKTVFMKFKADPVQPIDEWTNELKGAIGYPPLGDNGGK